jgi:hypothetical protein
VRRAHFLYVTAMAIITAPLTFGQVDSPSVRIIPNQEVHIANLQLHSAKSSDAQAVLVGSVETIFADAKVCCGKNSALGDAVLSADPASLQDVGGKLDGRHLLDDGRAVDVTVQYFLPDSASPGQIIAALTESQPLLMQWNGDWYIVQGAVFNEKIFTGGVHEYVLHKLLLLNAAPAKTQKRDSFDAEKDDWHEVQGLLQVTATLQ